MCPTTLRALAVRRKRRADKTHFTRAELLAGKSPDMTASEARAFFKEMDERKGDTSVHIKKKKRR